VIKIGAFVPPEHVGSGLSFVKKTEKEEIIKDETVLSVIGVKRGTTSFEGTVSEQYVVVFNLDDEVRALGFKIGSVESRDVDLDALQDYFANDEDPTPVDITLYKTGRSVLLKFV
jgi:hypothetical protein